jgi:hypothetical protein
VRDEAAQRAPLLLYAGAVEGHGTLGNSINFVARGGRRPLGRRGITINTAQTAETMPPHKYWCTAEKTRRARSLLGGPMGRSKRSRSATPPRRFRGTYSVHVCVSADMPVTMHRAVDLGAYAFSSARSQTIVARPFARCPQLCRMHYNTSMYSGAFA